MTHHFLTQSTGNTMLAAAVFQLAEAHSLHVTPPHALLAAQQRVYRSLTSPLPGSGSSGSNSSSANGHYNGSDVGVLSPNDAAGLRWSIAVRSPFLFSPNVLTTMAHFLSPHFDRACVRAALERLNTVRASDHSTVFSRRDVHSRTQVEIESDGQ